jgi:hypothetical protein
MLDIHTSQSDRVVEDILEWILGIGGGTCRNELPATVMIVPVISKSNMTDFTNFLGN